MILLYILIFFISCFILAYSGQRLIDSLSKIAKFLGWKEFVVAFFIMAFGASVPNFFVGVISAINGVPELSFGDIIGGNIVDLTLVIGISALISRAGLSAPSRIVQGSAIFTVGIAVLPLLLVSDGVLSRLDGFLLFLTFLIYVFWLFSKKERFRKVYDEVIETLTVKLFFKNFFQFLISLFLLLFAAQGIVKSAVFFANYFHFPIALIGILIVGLGNALPETFFSIHAAKRGQDWLILGDLMGGIIITSTLVLGMVAFINPIYMTNFSAMAIGRAFLIIAAIFFFLCLRSGAKITKNEGFVLLLIYVAFVIVEILSQI